MTEPATRGNGAVNDWTDERTEKLKALYSEGLSAAAIARALGGISRNGVIGKVSRLGLNGKKRGVPQVRQRPNFVPALKPVPVKPRGPDPEEPPSLQIQLVNIRDGQCRWPSDTEPYMFCGQPCEGVYCAYHMGVAKPKKQLTPPSLS